MLESQRVLIESRRQRQRQQRQLKSSSSAQQQKSSTVFYQGRDPETGRDLVERDGQIVPVRVTGNAQPTVGMAMLILDTDSSDLPLVLGPSVEAPRRRIQTFEILQDLAGAVLFIRRKQIGNREVIVDVRVTADAGQGVDQFIFTGLETTTPSVASQSFIGPQGVTVSFSGVGPIVDSGAFSARITVNSFNQGIEVLPTGTTLRVSGAFSYSVGAPMQYTASSLLNFRAQLIADARAFGFTPPDIAHPFPGPPLNPGDGPVVYVYTEDPNDLRSGGSVGFDFAGVISNIEAGVVAGGGGGLNVPGNSVGTVSGSFTVSWVVSQEEEPIKLWLGGDREQALLLKEVEESVTYENGFVLASGSAGGGFSVPLPSGQKTYPYLEVFSDSGTYEYEEFDEFDQSLGLFTYTSSGSYNMQFTDTRLLIDITGFDQRLPMNLNGQIDGRFFFDGIAPDDEIRVAGSVSIQLNFTQGQQVGEGQMFAEFHIGVVALGSFDPGRNALITTDSITDFSRSYDFDVVEQTNFVDVLSSVSNRNGLVTGGNFVMDVQYRFNVISLSNYYIASDSIAHYIWAQYTSRAFYFVVTGTQVQETEYAAGSTVTPSPDDWRGSRATFDFPVPNDPDPCRNLYRNNTVANIQGNRVYTIEDGSIIDQILGGQVVEDVPVAQRTISVDGTECQESSQESVVVKRIEALPPEPDGETTIVAGVNAFKK